MNNIGPPIQIVSESASRAEQYRKKSNTYQSANTLQRHTIKRLEAEVAELKKAKWVLWQIIRDLPAKRDWLNPTLESMARELTEDEEPTE